MGLGAGLNVAVGKKFLLLLPAIEPRLTEGQPIS